MPALARQSKESPSSKMNGRKKFYVSAPCVTRILKLSTTMRPMRYLISLLATTWCCHATVMTKDQIRALPDELSRSFSEDTFSCIVDESDSYSNTIYLDEGPKKDSGLSERILKERSSDSSKGRPIRDMFKSSAAGESHSTCKADRPSNRHRAPASAPRKARGPSTSSLEEAKGTFWVPSINEVWKYGGSGSCLLVLSVVMLLAIAIFGSGAETSTTILSFMVAWYLLFTIFQIYHNKPKEPKSYSSDFQPISQASINGNDRIYAGCTMGSLFLFPLAPLTVAYAFKPTDYLSEHFECFVAGFLVAFVYCILIYWIGGRGCGGQKRNGYSMAVYSVLAGTVATASGVYFSEIGKKINSAYDTGLGSYGEIGIIVAFIIVMILLLCALFRSPCG